MTLIRMWSLAVLAFGVLAYLAAQQVYDAELEAAGLAVTELHGNLLLSVFTIHPASLGVWLVLLLTGTLITVRVVADRSRREARAVEAERRHAAIFANSTEAILLTRPDGTVLDANPAAVRMFGRSVDELREMGRAAVVDTTDPRLTAALRERGRTGRFRGELRLRRADGSTFPAELVSAVFMDGDGQLRTSMIVRDISQQVDAQAQLQRREDDLVDLTRQLMTQNKELEATTAELERSNAAQRDFIGFVSHEFRTPLTGIQGFSEMIRDLDLAPADVREYARNIHEEAARLGRLVTQLLDLDRMESGQMVMERERIDLGELARRVAKEVSVTAPRHRFHAECDAFVVVLGDRDRLTDVLLNLLSNAVKYSPDGGNITVRVWKERGAARLSVTDDGLGIPKDMLDTVFERFVRVAGGQHRIIRGTGLGLPIVRKIAELHGGRVWAESVLGKGSTMHVTIPAVS